MTQDTSASPRSTPKHVWIIGIVALLWNATGAMDYVMTQTRNEAYMGQFTPEQLAYFNGFPAWVDATWAIAVWGGLLVAVGLYLCCRALQRQGVLSQGTGRVCPRIIAAGRPYLPSVPTPAGRPRNSADPWPGGR